MDMEKIQDLIYTNPVYCTCIRHESYVIGSGYFRVYLLRFNHGQATISKTAQECIDIIMIFITRLQSNIASFFYIKFLFNPSIQYTTFDKKYILQNEHLYFVS